MTQTIVNLVCFLFRKEYFVSFTNVVQCQAIGKKQKVCIKNVVCRCSKMYPLYLHIVQYTRTTTIFYFPDRGQDDGGKTYSIVDIVSRVYLLTLPLQNYSNTNIIHTYAQITIYIFHVIFYDVICQNVFTMLFVIKVGISHNFMLQMIHIFTYNILAKCPKLQDRQYDFKILSLKIFYVLRS